MHNASAIHLKAMVLAAGVGTRLDPLTSQLPKPLVPVANRAVMEYTLGLLVEHGFTQIFVNLHYLPDLIEKHFGDGSAFGVKMNYLFEKNLSGDAGGVRGCREGLQDDTFLVIMGDLLTDANLTQLLAEHKKKKALATIALKKVDDVSQLGIALLDENGWIKEFQEKPSAKEARSNLASTGIYILEPEIFHHIPKAGVYGFGRQLFPELLKLGNFVLGVPIENYWSDVGTFDQYRQSNFDVLEKKIRTSLPEMIITNELAQIWMGNNTYIKEPELVRGNLLVGNNSIVHEGVKILGNVVIGDNCVVEPGSTIEDCVIWSDSKISEQVSLYKSLLGRSSQIPAGQNLKETVFVMPKLSVCSELPSKFPSTASSKKG